MESNSRAAHALNVSLAMGICLLLAFGSLAFGGVQPWASFILEAGAALLLLIWAVRAIAFPRFEIIGSPLFIPMLLFAGLVGAQLLPHVSAYWHATWQKALLWAVYGILFFLSTQCFRSGPWCGRLSLAFTAFGFLVAMFAIAQEFAGNGKIYWVMENVDVQAFFGPYANHSHYAGLMEMLVPFPLVLTIAGFSSVPMRILYSCAAVIMASTIFLSGSRGGIVAFAAEVGFLTLLSSRGRRTRDQVALVGSFCLLLFLCLMLLHPNGLFDRFLQLRGPVDKAHDPNRITILKDSFQMVRQRPLLGWGFGTFPVVYPLFRSFYTDLAVNAAHNDFMELLVETGLCGFALMLAFLYLLYRIAVPKLTNWRYNARAGTSLAALVGCTGLLVHGFSDFNFQIPANAALFFVLAALAAGGALEPHRA